MLLESYRSVTFVRLFMVRLFIFGVEIFECALNQGNVIHVTEPGESDIWISGQTSYPIAWTQSKNSFKWNIALLDEKRNKVTDISEGLSEFNELKMIHHWLIPQSIQSGYYRIEICDSGSPSDCGSSNSFSIRNKEDLRSPNEIGSDVFSPLQAPQATFSQTNGSDKRTKDAEEFLFPHELRRRKRLRQQQLYFEHMTEQIKEQREAECTIERVHQPTKETFVENYMNRGKPVILTGMMDSWDAMKSWDFKQLGMILTKGVKVDILESLTPYSLWNEYRSRHTDMHKKPSKVHMNNFEEIYPELLSEFRFPEFYQDYMEVVDEDIRPVRLSFEMAPRRSGFHWRVESINASVWSALILGRKRWGLYPPSQYFVPGVVSNDHRSQDSQKSESFLWWAHTLPHLMEDYKPFECSQRLGEIFYIPSGWWWSNVNMDDSITLQKSVCDETNIRACMDELKELADNTPDNFYGDAFIQLRHFFTKHNPGLLTDDDREFRSPIKGLGKPFNELGQDHHEYVWKKYFEDEKDASAEDSSDNEPHKKG
ncbi:bifunctional arginine demethylase and lysyl-hydroxylase PSR-like [Montipora capricornis]|uniref:bifunctional arginine demethylase and lysyl-hydroxylase PSR-like n=1 Tax=Montipora capricornis TaxID=246305 RepID=UPI0035F1B408